MFVYFTYFVRFNVICDKETEKQEGLSFWVSG